MVPVLRCLSCAYGRVKCHVRTTTTTTTTRVFSQGNCWCRTLEDLWRSSWEAMANSLDAALLSAAGSARLRQWHRHERLTVQMALCEALHHAVLQVERGENSAPRGQKTHKAGGRSGALKEPEPPVGVVRAPSPRTAVPSLATPSLVDATADVVDASSLRPAHHSRSQ